MHFSALEIFLKVIHVIVCVFLVLVVLLQPGKGGIGAGFGGGSQQIFGGRGAGNLLTKATGVSATIFILTSVSLAYISSSGDRELKAKIAEDKRLSDAPLPDIKDLKEPKTEAPKEAPKTETPKGEAPKAP